ncbi:DUF2314 domain-containing protein [Lysobacter sp. MMG2]|uniref:DUF2314 domain-containing protein n=1 Tax=Lysobacter sp. MMG2 TaxID=2801338 RepID=UPI001C22916D|nr:DUF2314 domain-containing protein [Lysobacter sp. MMG2]
MTMICAFLSRCPKYAFVLMAAILVSACDSGDVSVPASHQKWGVAEDDHEWHQAPADANRSYPTFIERLRKPDGATGFSVKVLLTVGGKKEYLWLNPVRLDGAGLRGTINNRPVALASSMYGQSIEIRSDDVVDWMYQVGGKTIGARTACASLAKVDPEARRAYISKYGLQCE